MDENWFMLKDRPEKLCTEAHAAVVVFAVVAACC